MRQTGMNILGAARAMSSVPKALCAGVTIRRSHGAYQVRNASNLLQSHTDIPQILAVNRSHAQSSTHIGDIHCALKKVGAVKISLQFENDDCSYLEQVIRGLHQQHRYGLPIDHSAGRGWFWDIRPSPDIPTSEYRARSETADPFPWHTDCSYESAPPSYFALQVLQPDRCNGGTLSILQVDQVVGLLSPAARLALSKPEFRINVPPEFIKRKDQQHLIGRLLRFDTTNSNETALNAQIRFREDIVEPLTDDAKRAFAELKSIITGPEAARRALHLTPDMLPRGSIILLNNSMWLHARNEVRDPNRHLRRVRFDPRPFEASSLQQRELY